MIRVLNLFTIMNRGGAETMVMNYYRHIDRSKVQFDFMVHREERGAYDDEIEALGGRIFRMPSIRPWKSSSYRKMVAEFYKAHPEYKVIHSHMSELGYYDFLEAEKAGVPVRISHAHNRPHGVDLKSPMRWYYKTKMLPHATHMFMCGEESGDWLFGKKNRERFIFLKNAVDSEAFDFDPGKRKEIRKALGVDNEFVIGHVGRFDKQKNHKFILEVFCEVLKKELSAVLLLVGDDSGSLGKEIRSLVKKLDLDDRVRFLGVRSDVSDLMQAMDVFLFPSLFEGFGIVALEAQASGLPCVVSEFIPDECAATDLLHRISLKREKEYWADEVLKAAEVTRKSMRREIIRSGFDIKENAKWLQDFYLSFDKGE